MKRLLLLIVLAVLLVGAGASQTKYANLEVVKNASMDGPIDDYSVVEFEYQGRVSGLARDPFALTVNITGKDTVVTEDNFELSGVLRTGENYSLQCAEKASDFDPDWMLETFYKNSINNVEEDAGKFYCFPDGFYPLQALGDEGSVRINFDPNIRLEPDDFTVWYGFTAPEGEPSFDPEKSTDGPDNTVEFREGDFVIDSEDAANYTLTAFSEVYREPLTPLGEDFSTAYFRLEPDKDTDAELTLSYDQEQFEERELQDPRLYIYAGSGEGWNLLPEQSSGEGTLNASLNGFGLFGVFTSKTIDTVVETDTEVVSSGGGGGGEIDLGQDNEAESEEDEDGTENQELQDPSASFDFEFVEQGDTIEVELNATDSFDPDGEIVSYRWNFGETGEVETLSMEESEEVDVTLTVEDSQGLQDSITREIDPSRDQILSDQGSTEDIDENGSDPSQSLRNPAGQFFSEPGTIGLSMLAFFAAIVAFLHYSGRIELRKYISKVY